MRHHQIMVFSLPFPIILGGEIFWTLSIFGSFLLIFFSSWGQNSWWGHRQISWGITQWAFWDILIYYILNFFCLRRAMYLSLSQCCHSSTLYSKIFALIIRPNLLNKLTMLRVLLSTLNHFCPTSCKDPTLITAAEKQ